MVTNPGESGAEKRRRRRVRADLDCNWGWGDDARKRGRVSSLSVSGCFIVTTALVQQGTGIVVHLWLPERRWLKVRGHVLYVMERVGLGVGFDDLSEEEGAEFERLLDHLEENPPPSPQKLSKPSPPLFFLYGYPRP